MLWILAVVLLAVLLALVLWHSTGDAARAPEVGVVCILLALIVLVGAPAAPPRRRTSTRLHLRAPPATLVAARPVARPSLRSLPLRL